MDNIPLVCGVIVISIDVTIEVPLMSTLEPKQKGLLNQAGALNFLVETGESRTPRPREAAQNMLQA